VSAAPTDVFGAWLDPHVARRWLFATATVPLVQAEIDARVGGAFRFVARHGDEVALHRGVYVEIAPHRRLAFTLQSGAEPSPVGRVTVQFEAQRHSCGVALVHDGVAPADARAQRDRWLGLLYGLDATLAGASTPGRNQR
jgi:uncharacterized protein YndB with AHSA1/START domain